MRSFVRRPCWSVPLTFALWANLHGGFVLGLALIVLDGTASLIEHNRLFFRRLAVLFAIAAAATVRREVA